MSIATTLVATLGLALVGQGDAPKPIIKVPNMPKIIAMSTYSTYVGKAFDVYAQNFWKPCFMLFKRADGTGTVENGGYGTAEADAWSMNAGQYKVRAPSNLKPGDFKVSLVAHDLKSKTPPISMKIV